MLASQWESCLAGLGYFCPCTLRRHAHEVLLCLGQQTFCEEFALFHAAGACLPGLWPQTLSRKHSCEAIASFNSPMLELQDASLAFEFLARKQLNCSQRGDPAIQRLAFCCYAVPTATYASTGNLAERSGGGFCGGEVPPKRDIASSIIRHIIFFRTLIR